MGKVIIFLANAKLSGRSQPPKMKHVFLVFIKRKTEFIPPSEMKICPKSGFILIIIGLGESGKAILNEANSIVCVCRPVSVRFDCMLFGQVRLAVFFRALSKYFLGKKMAQPPIKRPVYR